MPRQLIGTLIGGGSAASGGGGGSGDVVGPAAATDNTFPRYDSTTGKLLQAGQTTEDDSGNVATAGHLLPGKRLKGRQGVDVASAAEIILGDGNYHVVTGTTTIHSMITGSDWTSGSVVYLQFSDNIQIKHNGTPDSGAAFVLAGAVDFNATDGDTLTVIRDSPNDVWRETSRSVI
jgi:hypothetical protein